MLQKTTTGGNALEIAVFALQDRLRVASSLEGRQAAIEALLAVTEFLSVISGPGGRLHQRPLNGLISALISLDDGKVVRLLKPVKRTGRARNSLAQEAAKAAAVFVVRRLCVAGLAADDAHGKVAAVCREAGIVPGRTGAPHQKPEVTARTVRQWDAAVAEDVGVKTRAGRQYSSLMSALSFLTRNATPEVLLGMLRGHFIATRPR